MDDFDFCSLPSEEYSEIYDDNSEIYQDNGGYISEELSDGPEWVPDEATLEMMYEYGDSDDDEQEESLGEGPAIEIADDWDDNIALYQQEPKPLKKAKPKTDKRKRGKKTTSVISVSDFTQKIVSVFGTADRPKNAFIPIPEIRRVRKKGFPKSGNIKDMATAIYDALPLSKREGQRAMLEYMAEGMDAARREREELTDEAANGTVIDKSILPYKIGAAEAPVGTGKSYVLLILAFSAWYLYGKRTVISTYTKVLQNQLYTKDLPNFIRMLRDYVAKTGIIEAERVNEWRFGVVKGKSNYMCPLILDKYKETTSKYGDLVFKLPWANSNTVLIGLTKLMAIEQAVMGIRDLDRTGAIFEDDPTYPLLCASPFNCEKARNNHGGECPYANTNCPSLQSRRLTNDLLIVNHKLLEQTFETVTQPKENIIAQNEKEEFKSEKQDLKGIPNVLKAEYYFFDEAHHLMGYSAGVPDVSDDSLYSSELLAAMSVPVPSYIENNICKEIFEIRAYLWELWKKIIEDINDDYEKYQKYKFSAKSMYSEFNCSFFDKNKKQGLYTRIKDHIQNLCRLCSEAQCETDELIKSAVDTKDFWQKFINVIESKRLNITGKNINETIDVSAEGIEFTEYKERSFESDMAQHAPYMEYTGFVSGTLFVGNSAKTFELETGIFSLKRGIIVPSPYKHSLINLWIPEKRKDKNETPTSLNYKQHTEDVINFCKQYVPPYIKEDLGGVLILCTSVKRMNEVAKALRPELEKCGRVLLVQGTQTRSKLVKSFMANSSPVLVACDSFREGFDAPEEKLTWVILDKLPFKNPSSNSYKARINMLMKKHAYENDRIHSINLMLVSLAQSVGRLERSEYDWGTLTILDPRIEWFYKDKKNISPNSVKSVSELAGCLDLDMKKIIQSPGTELRTISGPITVNNWIKKSRKLKLEAECAKYNL